MPSLAGIDAQYFTEQMKAFRDGKRQAAIMHQLSKGYSDEQIVQAGRVFAARKKD
jgi:cytochrome c553